MVHLVVAVDRAGGAVRLAWDAPGFPPRRGELVVSGTALSGEAPLVLAAAAAVPDGEATWPFDGKLADPQLARRDWSPPEARAFLDRGVSGRIADDELLAAWRFAEDPSGCSVSDACGGQPLALYRLPTRAVTGPRWRGDGDLAVDPEAYDAIHFHSDDLDDAAWEPDLELTLPTRLPSGVYGIELHAQGAEDCVPLFVHPPQDRHERRGHPVSDRLLSRLCQRAHEDEPRSALSRPVQSDAGDVILKRHPEYGGSVYDTHTDGSGVCLSSSRRPILNLRPGHRNWQTHAPRALSADLYLVDWLDRDGVRVDTITDHLLISEGLELLRRYRVVITGSHPEYWTASMLDAVAAWLDEGGRLMYLGGNGFYWVTAIHPEHPHVVEVRRGTAGIRSWESAAGESRLQSTGEPGGLWRYRGRDPNRLVGVGFAGFGFDPVAPGYERRAGSRDPRASWIFEGLDQDELIGDRGLILGGAAGDEVDRCDRRWGSPPHALVLASSEGRHTASLQLVVEDVLMTSPDTGGDVNPGARSDLVFFETAGGGAVFSVGSMAWNGALAVNAYANAVATITRNVLSRFRDPEPFPAPPPAAPIDRVSDAMLVGPAAAGE